MAMGAYLNAVNNGGRPTVFGGKGRGLSYGMDAIGKPSAVGTVYTYEWARYILEDSWGITGREELIQTVCRMTYYGHNADFQADVAMIEGMSAAEYREVLKNAEGMDAYMFPYTKRLGHPVLGPVPHEQSGPVGLRGGLPYLSRGPGPAGAGGRAGAGELQKLG